MLVVASMIFRRLPGSAMHLITGVRRALMAMVMVAVWAHYVAFSIVDDGDSASGRICIVPAQRLSSAACEPHPGMLLGTLHDASARAHALRGGGCIKAIIGDHPRQWYKIRTMLGADRWSA